MGVSSYKAQYWLHGGYVHHWLVAGPQATPVVDLDRFPGSDYKLQIARHYYEQATGVTELPVEGAALAPGDASPVWRYVHCLDDHLVDLTAFYHTCHYLRAWAYCEVECSAQQAITAVLTTNGPADVWLNGAHVHRQEHFYHQLPHSVPFAASFQAGRNEVLVRFEEVAARECPFGMALQLPGLPEEGVRVWVPTFISQLDDRALLERTYDAAYVDRDVFAEDDTIAVHWPGDLAEQCHVAVRLQQPSGWTYAETFDTLARPAAAQRMVSAVEIPDGPFQIVLIPPHRIYYEDRLRIAHTIDLQVAKARYSTAPYGTMMERRIEALIAASRQEGNVFAEIAKMALGRWPQVDADVVMKAIDGINRRQDCSDFYLTGLLGMMHRYGADPAFPAAIRSAMEACVLGFKYWMDEPGADAMCYWSENHQILFHTCEVLAGQLYPERTFANAQQSGQWHREKAEHLALAWLRKRASGGFREWDSNCYFEEDLLALSHLADLAENDELRELASVVVDKMLFTIALNSYRGTFGSTHGRTYTPFIRGSRLEPTSGITRLMWGMGAFNDHIMGTVSLACAEGYEMPPIIAAIAADSGEAQWSRERHAGELEAACDCETGPWEVNKVTYKTPDYMLSSAQDYHPGESGYQQHIWQATLGPDAVVFVTHPPCMSQDGSHRPNFWHGNVVLPRVAQWRDVLIAVHSLPEDDWLGFTHAYFPTYAFDEHALHDGWAFARKGDGYLALTAARGMTLITHGDGAYRELRSYGRQNAWLCHMGRAAHDGTFAEFEDRVLRLEVALDGPAARCATLRGDSLAFAWQGPLLVNGKEEPLGGFRHYDSPYCSMELGATQMEIHQGESGLLLNFE